MPGQSRLRNVFRGLAGINGSAFSVERSYAVIPQEEGRSTGQGSRSQRVHKSGLSGTCSESSATRRCHSVGAVRFRGSHAPCP
eukprot:9843996-Lingulodinium_polyedra.AAC.1